MAKPALRIVDTNGEIQPSCPQCEALHDQVQGLESELRSYRAKLRQLKRDREAEAHRHDLWERATRLFTYWQTQTGHTRSRFSYERFWDAVPALKTYEDDIIEKAIRGIAFDPNTRQNRNGTTTAYDHWETLFANVGRIEWYSNRAPLSA